MTLTNAEREIVLTIADDEQSWHVHTDSLRAASTRFRKVARALGIEPVRVGHGWEFTLPLGAVKVLAPRPRTDAQQKASHRLGTSSQSKFRPRTPVT